MTLFVKLIHNLMKVQDVLLNVIHSSHLIYCDFLICKGKGAVKIRSSLPTNIHMMFVIHCFSAALLLQKLFNLKLIMTSALTGNPKEDFLDLLSVCILKLRFT